MDNQLMLGVLLIIVGIAVGLIAVALVLNRREGRIAAESELEGEEHEEPSAAADVDGQPTPEEDGDEVRVPLKTDIPLLKNPS